MFTNILLFFKKKRYCRLCKLNSHTFMVTNGKLCYSSEEQFPPNCERVLSNQCFSERFKGELMRMRNYLEAVLQLRSCGPRMRSLGLAPAGHVGQRCHEGLGSVTTSNHILPIRAQQASRKPLPFSDHSPDRCLTWGWEGGRHVEL